MSERVAAKAHHVIARRANDARFPGTLITVDLEDRQKAQEACDDICARYRIDGVVYNVGLVRPQRLGAIELDDLDAVLGLNLHPAVQAVQAAVPDKRAKGVSSVFPA